MKVFGEGKGQCQQGFGFIRKQRIGREKKERNGKCGFVEVKIEE